MMERSIVATKEEQAIAAINAAETMALSNVQLIRQLKSMLPASVRPLVEPAITLQEAQIGAVASVEKAIVRKVARTARQRKQDKKKSEAWALANAKGRRKNGEYYAGWDQRRIAEYANKVLRRM